jgi:hypothetical protein
MLVYSWRLKPRFFILVVLITTLLAWQLLKTIKPPLPELKSDQLRALLLPVSDIGGEIMGSPETWTVESITPTAITGNWGLWAVAFNRNSPKKADGSHHIRPELAVFRENQLIYLAPGIGGWAETSDGDDKQPSENGFTFAKQLTTALQFKNNDVLVRQLTIKQHLAQQNITRDDTYVYHLSNTNTNSPHIDETIALTSLPHSHLKLESNQLNYTDPNTQIHHLVDYLTGHITTKIASQSINSYPLLALNSNQSPYVDGQNSEWSQDSPIRFENSYQRVGGTRGRAGAEDCSGNVYLRYNKTQLFVYLECVDNRLHPYDGVRLISDAIGGELFLGLGSLKVTRPGVRIARAVLRDPYSGGVRGYKLEASLPLSPPSSSSNQPLTLNNFELRLEDADRLPREVIYAPYGLNRQLHQGLLFFHAI